MSLTTGNWFSFRAQIKVKLISKTTFFNSQTLHVCHDCRTGRAESTLAFISDLCMMSNLYDLIENKCCSVLSSRPSRPKWNKMPKIITEIRTNVNIFVFSDNLLDNSGCREFHRNFCSQGNSKNVNISVTSTVLRLPHHISTCGTVTLVTF